MAQIAISLYSLTIRATDHGMFLIRISQITPSNFALTRLNLKSPRKSRGRYLSDEFPNRQNFDHFDEI